MGSTSLRVTSLAERMRSHLSGEFLSLPMQTGAVIAGKPEVRLACVGNIIDADHAFKDGVGSHDVRGFAELLNQLVADKLIGYGLLAHPLTLPLAWRGGATLLIAVYSFTDLDAPTLKARAPVPCFFDEGGLPDRFRWPNDQRSQR